MGGGDPQVVPPLSLINQLEPASGSLAGEPRPPFHHIWWENTQTQKIEPRLDLLKVLGMVQKIILSRKIVTYGINIKI